jgi:pimeloyl-ACP methyl ester carboxylesterase
MQRIFLIVLTTLAMSAKAQNSDFKTKYETQYLHFDNYKVHFLKKGNGSPILLIHGGGTWMYSWRNIIDSLSQSHTVYACDMPGHGYTVAEKEPKYNLDDFAYFIDSFLNHFNIDKIKIIGNSWGGGWALYYAEKFPDKVEKLILIDPAGLNVKDVFEWEILKYPLLGELASKMVTKNAVKKAFQKVYVNQTLVDSVLIEEAYKPLKIKQNQRAMYKIKRHCKWKITEKQMVNITIPTKIIWGEKDNYLNVKHAKSYAAKIKTSDLTIMKNCGHTPHEEQPNETLKILKDFLTQ